MPRAMHFPHVFASRRACDYAAALAEAWSPERDDAELADLAAQLKLDTEVLNRIIKGERRIYPAEQQAFIDVSRFLPDEEAYFRLLVHFDDESNAARVHALSQEINLHHRAAGYHSAELDLLEVLQDELLLRLPTIIALFDGVVDETDLRGLLYDEEDDERMQEGVLILERIGALERRKDGRLWPIPALAPLDLRVVEVAAREGALTFSEWALDRLEAIPGVRLVGIDTLVGGAPPGATGPVDKRPLQEGLKRLAAEGVERSVRVTNLLAAPAEAVESTFAPLERVHHRWDEILGGLEGGPRGDDPQRTVLFFSRVRRVPPAAGDES